MIVRAITVQVKEDAVEAFREATKKNHEGSIREPGILRFDVLQNSEKPTEFLLYEVYRDEAATKAHKETAHYAEWKERVADMMAGERVGKSYEVVAPVAEKDWAGGS